MAIPQEPSGDSASPPPKTTNQAGPSTSSQGVTQGVTQGVIVPVFVPFDRLDQDGKIDPRLVSQLVEEGILNFDFL